MKKYVLQMRAHEWDTHWVTTSLEFDTLEEAKAALAQRHEPWYRIAEAYTVTRYKAVRL